MGAGRHWRGGRRARLGRPEGPAAGPLLRRRRQSARFCAGRPDPARFSLSDKEGVVRQDPAVSCQFWHEVLMSFRRAGLAPLVLILILFLTVLGGGISTAWAQQIPPAPSPAGQPPLTIM